MKRWLCILVVLLLFLLAGCSEQPLPEEAFDTYISHWNNQEFDKMYDGLASEVKERVSKEEFIKRYSSIY